MSLKRNAWVFVLALALSGTMVACGDGDGDGGGSGGTGGTGGTGGFGGTGGSRGTGGSGGGTPTCTPACNEGEECVVSGTTAECQCDPNPDSCPQGQFCNPDFRCENLPVVDDFNPCTTEDETFEAEDGSIFYCTTYPGQDTPWWLRVCGAPEDCKNAQTFCLGNMLGYDPQAGGVPFCYFNLCGDASIGPQLELDPPIPGNGVPFGGCSSTQGYLETGATEDGTCVPLTFGDGSLGGICIKNGAAPKDGDCHADAYKDEAQFLCTADSQCLAFRADEPRRPCTADAACAQVPVTIDGETYQFDGYCSKDGTCQTVGFCGDNCNSGTAGAGYHANAGCSDPAGVCSDLSGNSPANAAQEGYCRAACTMFDVNACPEYPAGQQRACYPGFDEEPLAGYCIDQATTTKAVGETCSQDADASECPDNAACLQLTGAPSATCIQWCNCTGGFDANGVCNDATVNSECAPTGTVCGAAVEGSPIGICVTAG